MKITDKMRLDWLFKTGATVIVHRGMGSWVERTYCGSTTRLSPDPINVGPRQAIDAAIRAGERNK